MAVGDIRFVAWDTDSTVATVTALDGSRYTHSLGKPSRAELRAEREAIQGLALNEDDTKVFLSTDRYGQEFGGRLAGVRWRGEQAAVVVDSFEADAEFADPAGDGTGTWRYENADDSTIIGDAVDRVAGDSDLQSPVSRGQIDTVETGLSFRFSRVTQAKLMRTVARDGDGELFYNADGSVDYVDTLGRDRTHITLSETGHRIDGEPEVTGAEDNPRINTLTLLGSGEGPGQLTATKTASGFDANTDRPKAGVRHNPRVSDQGTLDTLAQRLVDDFNSDYTDFEATIRNERILLGDEYNVSYPSKDVDADLRAVTVTTVLANDGRTHDVTFSNRNQTRGTLEEEVVEATQRAGRVIEGFTVPLSQSAGPGWVDTNRDFRFRVPYPNDIQQEVTVDLVIEGLRYMDPSGGSLSTQSDFPQDCNVKVNGSTASNGPFSFGDGNSAFIETVDLAGDLVQGEDNTIDVTSENIGMIRCTWSAELYRTMTGGN